MIAQEQKYQGSQNHLVTINQGLDTQKAGPYKKKLNTERVLNMRNKAREAKPTYES